MASDRYDTRGIAPFERPGSDIKKMGVLRKLKTNKKKYFVLRSTSSSGPARLEYFDSEKKFRNGQLPKRSIQLHTLLNINKKSDSKHKYAIALYTKDDCFSVMAEDEGDLEDWYALLLVYQCEYLREGDSRREHFEHVWQVTIQPKGLGTDKTLRGNFRLCLSQKCLSLFRVNSDKAQVSFQLATVRSHACSGNFFRMEVGSWAPTGAGELWMHVEDAVIAQSMHDAILNCMQANVGGFDETESHRFDKRAESIHGSGYRVRQHTEPFRDRTVSESHTHSPRRMRTAEDQPRPISSVYPTPRSAMSTDAVSPGTSPLAHIDLLHGSHRFRSDSVESRASRSSMHAPSDDLSPMEFPALSSLIYSGPPSEPSYPVLREEEQEMDSYCDQDFSPHDFASVSSSPGKGKTPLEEEPGERNPYMDMRPGNTTPPAPANSSGSGYIPMNLGSSSGSHEILSSTPVESDSYMTMGPGRKVSDPIPIKSGNSGGYMDMSHSSHLPTVREGGSNEGYLPMTPNSGQSPIVSSHLRPDPAVCMLSDDSVEFPKRTYSLGSRPPAKSSARIPSVHDPVPIKRGIMDNEGRSCSAPHLITHRGRNLNVESPTPSASPLSMSLKSESSYRSDDSDSFMELDFHRPRTASDSYGYRPRASSFGKTPIQALQGHRPRSSSYGQGVRTFKLKQGTRLGSYESVRTTSQELLHRSSIDSLSHRSSKDSLRVSSNESLRKLSEEVRTKTNLLNKDYMDMSLEKRKTPSPQPPMRGRENGYMDMTLGARTTSPSRSKTSHDSSNSHKSQSSERLHTHGHSDDSYASMEAPEMTSSTSSSGSTYINLDLQGQGHHAQHSTGIPGQKSSDKTSKPVSEDSYVMYEPCTVSGAADVRRSSEEVHQKSGKLESLKKKSRHSDKGKEHRHKSGVSSKRKSRHESKDTHVTKVPAQSPGIKEPPTAADEYIEFAPASTGEGSSSVEKQKHEPTRIQSDYVGFEPGVVSSRVPVSKPQTVKSYFSQTKMERTKEPSKALSESRVAPPVSSDITSKRTLQTVSDYVLSSPKVKSPISPVKEDSGYVLSSPIGTGQSETKTDKKESDYVLSSEVVVASSVSKGTSDSKDSLHGSVTKSSSSSAGKVRSSVSDTKTSQKPMDISSAVAGSKKGNTVSVETGDSAYCTVDLPAKAGEGSSVDPVVPGVKKSASEQASQGTHRILRSVSSDPRTGESKTAKTALKAENVQSPAGSRKEKQVGRAKHSSGNVGPSPKSVLLTSECKDSLSDKGTSALTRPESTPCMLTLDKKEAKPPPPTATLTVDQNPRSRHSISDLSAYEQMTFPSNTLSTQQQSSSNTSASSQQKGLNYASLDLGSSETFSDGDSNLRSPRTKSRHSSSADEKGEPPLSYAQIDFEKSETLKSAAANKDVKFTL